VRYGGRGNVGAEAEGGGGRGDLGAKYGEPSGAEYGELCGTVLLGSFAEEGRLGDSAWRDCVEDRRGCVGGYTDWTVRRDCVGGLAVGAGAERSTGVGDVYSGGTRDVGAGAARDGGTRDVGAGAEDEGGSGDLGIKYKGAKLGELNGAGLLGGADDVSSMALM
jgi:hypothetical protein